MEYTLLILLLLIMIWINLRNKISKSPGEDGGIIERDRCLA